MYLRSRMAFSGTSGTIASSKVICAVEQIERTGVVRRCSFGGHFNTANAVGVRICNNEQNERNISYI